MSKKEKVIKSLSMCIETAFSSCGNCPYNREPNCFNELYSDTVSLINNKKLFNERIRDFSKKLKEKIYEEFCNNREPYIIRCNPVLLLKLHCIIDNLVEELIKEND